MTTKEKAIEMINEGLKKCKICDTIKPKSDFYKEKKASDGYKSQCKDCYNTRKEKRNVARLKAEKATLPFKLCRSWQMYWGWKFVCRLRKLSNNNDALKKNIV